MTASTSVTKGCKGALPGAVAHVAMVYLTRAYWDLIELFGMGPV